MVRCLSDSSEKQGQTRNSAAPDAVAIDNAALPGNQAIWLADRFAWSPALPGAGEYAVYAKWQAGEDRAADAVYEVTHGGGVAQVTVGQQAKGAATAPLTLR